MALARAPLSRAVSENKQQRTGEITHDQAVWLKKGMIATLATWSWSLNLLFPVCVSIFQINEMYQTADYLSSRFMAPKQRPADLAGNSHLMSRPYFNCWCALQSLWGAPEEESDHYNHTCTKYLPDSLKRLAQRTWSTPPHLSFLVHGSIFAYCDLSTHAHTPTALAFMSFGIVFDTVHAHLIL
jgi:hypothetical protein